ncbi:hypothetical protein GCM10010495_17990 [Kitasatospora herbaricolor]|uniref:DUF3987 domain-containing protein n=1 Tax=Kitasatospora herbaricolor TaxID=68217 RepID=UPI001748C18F|nr:DUF3987 domain-containing protein [Kitasatospora herbaricolor]MDQ0308247.1 DNA primase [Kitasatospora herbaricolor]GGV06269.1 hypothetical protein GCM10010495_17990 [Kitasatospora herbaricolor]
MVSALDRVRDALTSHGSRSDQTGRSWQCPAHEDRNPSLSVGAGTKGADVVLHCHAGCANEDVVAALGLTLADLYDEPAQKKDSRPVKVAEYPYCDENGELLYKVARYTPKTFRQFAADGTPSVKGIRRVPYRLPAVLAEARAGGLVLIVEGEKDVDNLATAGVVATCNAGGAGKWTDDHTRHLLGAGEIVVVADKDGPGRAHAAQVAESLQRAGIPHRVVEPAAGKDVSDHLAAGLGFAELVTVDPRPTYPTIPNQSQPADPHGDSGISGTRFEDDGWDVPIPLDARPLPPFPVEHLGELGAFVTANAASLQVPPDLVAFAALATISTATGGRRQVRVKADWRESLALYLAALADSSEKKTPALNAAAAPLREIEDILIEAARPQVEAMAQEIRITQGQMAKAEQKATGDKPENALADAEGFRMKLLELGEQPELPRLLIRDATLEAIAKVMHGQGGRIGLLASEGGLIKVAGGLYGSNGKANTDLLLEAYTGSPYTIDRTGRSSARMSTTFLSVGLIIQPGVLAGLEKKNPEFRENGLLGRFLFARPAPTEEDTFDSPPVPHGVTDAYAKRIRSLIERVWNREEVLALDLDQDARIMFGEFYNGFAKRRKPGGDLHDVADWAGKFRGQLIRIAGCLTVYENPEATHITRERMASVLAMAPYFIAHAKAVFDLMGADGDGRLGPLRDLLAWLRGRPDPAASFSVRDAWQALKGRKWAGEAEDVTTALGELEDHGWIAFLPPPDRPGVRGRKPSPRFDVHPLIYTKSETTTL